MYSRVHECIVSSHLWQAPKSCSWLSRAFWHPCAHAPHRATQVMSRQEAEPENQLVLKRPRQDYRLIQHSSSTSIPRSIVSNVRASDMSPFIRGFQNNMSNWVSNLIQHQDGCLQMVAQQATKGRLRQEQLAQTAKYATMPSQNDQVSYLRAQLAHREAQLEQVRAERDNHFIQEEEEALAASTYVSTQQLIKRLEIQSGERSRTSALPRECPSCISCHRSSRSHG